MTEKEMLVDIGEQLYSATKFMQERGVLKEFHQWCLQRTAAAKEMRAILAAVTPADTKVLV
jgi:hypothetical protein